jgi:hypothetical protein
VYSYTVERILLYKLTFKRKLHTNLLLYCRRAHRIWGKKSINLTFISTLSIGLVNYSRYFHADPLVKHFFVGPNFLHCVLSPYCPQSFMKKRTGNSIFFILSSKLPQNGMINGQSPMINSNFVYKTMPYIPVARVDCTIHRWVCQISSQDKHIFSNFGESHPTQTNQQESTKTLKKFLQHNLRHMLNIK